ncbi:unannotated protein [freshwater metagenome]|uniref:Unannotated protein n=1 Tax=freshwater metagenome TaxID=449393 RepID=A0A6J7QL53_9ZZZZ|nr:hypothetical protein [Actinomycetota bacterium]
MGDKGSLKLKVQKAPAEKSSERASDRALLKVLVDTGVFHLDQAYDYLLPAQFGDSVEVGTMVKVPFGNRTCTGLVIERSSNEVSAGTKFIDSAITSIPVLDHSTIALLQRTAHRYACDIWELIPDAVPGRVAGMERLFHSVTPPIAPNLPGKRSHSLKILEPGTSYIEQIRDAVLSRGHNGQVLVVVPDEKDLSLLLTSLAQRVDEEILSVSSALERSERYRNHLRALYRKPAIVIGTRNAIFTPLLPGSTIIVFQDGEESLVSRRSPEWSVRDIALLRAADFDLTFLSFTPTLEIARLVETGWLSLQASTIKQLSLAFDESKTSSDAVISNGLKSGSVLVTVAAPGYVNSFSCQKCRNHALCICGGRLMIDRSKGYVCSLCDAISSAWACNFCGQSSPRALSRGSSRIGEELGRAHPGISIITSSGKKRVDLLPNGKHLVVATNGAEPIGEYAAVVLLGGDSLFNRIGLHAEESARRSWFTALSLMKIGGEGFVSLPSAHPISQSLLKWSLYPQIDLEIKERAAADLPPYSRILTIEGKKSEISQLRIVLEEVEIFERVSALDLDGEFTKLILRVPIDKSEALSEFVRDFKRVRSLKSLPPLRIRLDPYEI